VIGSRKSDIGNYDSSMKVMKRVVLALLLLAVVLALAAYVYIRRSLPEYDGTIQVAGISAPVEIVRDAGAVPHIFASTKLDALYGLGYVHAQDRLWQMEFQRRVGHGRLSEIFGDATLREDRFLRTVGFGRAARRAWEHLPRDARTQIDAYVGGVNAFILSHHGSRLPPEFTLLRFEPEPWSGPDVLVWVKMMAWDLSANYAQELLRHDIAARIGVERVPELMPPYPANGLNILNSLGATNGAPDTANGGAGRAHNKDSAGRWSEAFARSFSTATSTPHPALRSLLLGGGGATEGLGSNNWVVDGTLTASGKPLLANDPHLATQIPSLWYLAHMSAGDFDVIGATLPGTPAIVIGRNKYIAWGETNMFADVEDLYRERLDPSGRNAEFNGQFEPLHMITETIAVKGAEPIHVDVRISRHGPLVSDAINANNAASAAGEDTKDAVPPIDPLAFRWTALDDEDGTIVAFLQLNVARNWTDFTAALREFVAPSQNFVYADVDGHIGYYAPGRVPIRAGGDGLMPADGWTGAMEWTGWIPFDDLPHTYDPPSHFIVTANNRPVPADYPYVLGAEYHEPYRAQRITDLLQNKKRLTPDDFRAIQSDTFSLNGQTLLPLLLQHVQPQSVVDQQAVDLLRKWDFDARGDSAAAAIFEAWFHQLAPKLVGDELGPAVTATYERRFSSITRFVAMTLSGGSQSLCDDIRTEVRETCDARVSAALHDGVSALARQLGSDMSRWRWDAAHRAVFPHQGLDTVPGLHWLLSRSMANGGDWSSVNVGAVAVDHPFEQREIPGYRQIVDLSPVNDSRFLASVGQAGHFLSRYYDEMLQDWHDVRHRRMNMERSAIDRDAVGRLRLVPQ